MNSYSLIELQRFIQRVLALNFEQAFWIKAEIGQASLSRGHFFLQLIQKAEDSEDIIAESRANLWSRQMRQIQDKTGKQLPLDQLLKTGNEVEILVEVQHHERYGLSLNILDLNPAFSLGQLAQQKQETLDRLIKDKLLDKNKNQRPPAIIQNIAVLSSPNAAGLADFKNQLINNSYGYRFNMELYPVAVQGQHASSEIIQALKKIQGALYKPELIIILRGGGSKLDLAAFDALDLCLTVAQCNLPVLAAVGHETDESVLDLVAYDNVKTPTAAADFLIERCILFESQLNQIEKQLSMHTQQAVNLRKLEINQLRESIKHAAINTIQSKQFLIEQLGTNIISKSRLNLQAKKLQLLNLEKALQTTNPELALEKGFTLTTNDEGRIVRSIDQLKNGGKMVHYFRDGIVNSVITKISKK